VLEEEGEATLLHRLNNPIPINLKLAVLLNCLLPVWSGTTFNNPNNLSTLNKANSNNPHTAVKAKQLTEHPLEELIKWQISFRG
jgi:hypothetical protein